MREQAAPDDLLYIRGLVADPTAKRNFEATPEDVRRAGKNQEQALLFTGQGYTDDSLIGKYRTGFLDAFTQHTTRQQNGGGMFFEFLGWGDAEAAVLVRAIAYAVRHCEFEEGAEPVRLVLYGNKFGEEAKADIRGACGGKIEGGI